MINAYPELASLPYFPTKIAMPDVIDRLRGIKASPEVKRSAYVMFRNESGNGASGINNNFIGAQADSGRWPEHLTPLFSGTVIKNENQTGKQRIFLAFKDVTGCLTFLCERVQSRGLYVGGATHKIVTMAVNSPNDLAVAYHREWVRGSATAMPGANEVNAFLSMYRQAEGFFVS